MFLLFRIRYIYFNPILLLLGYRFYDVKTSNSKTILYEKNGLKQVPMASTTKIMTAIM